MRGFGATPGAPTAYANTISYTWDNGDRLTKIADSLSGDILREYDELDRLKKETTAQGIVEYTYDAAGRRTTMQVSGQPKITYTWDDANRLKEIKQDAGPANGNAAQTVSFTYDAAGRGTQTKFTSGFLPQTRALTIDYGYDNADRVTSMTYKLGGVLGTLTYTYDAAGRRTGTGGSFAKTQLPQTASLQ